MRPTAGLIGERRCLANDASSARAGKAGASIIDEIDPLAELAAMRRKAERGFTPQMFVSSIEIFTN